jgi:hypothetical protein
VLQSILRITVKTPHITGNEIARCAITVVEIRIVTGRFTSSVNRLMQPVGLRVRLTGVPRLIVLWDLPAIHTEGPGFSRRGYLEDLLLSAMASD